MAEKKILLVDYDKKSIEALKTLFSPYPLQIITAMDGQAAYEKFVEDTPDIVLLEPMLPKLHGFDLAKKIRDESEGKIPIIIVTALYKGSQYRNEAVKTLGVAGYFEKPYDEKDVRDAVLNIIHEEGSIEEDLPDPEEIIKTLTSLVDGLPEEGHK